MPNLPEKLRPKWMGKKRGHNFRSLDSFTDNSFYNSRLWRKTRILHLKSEPLCRHCAQHGVTTAATDVDHIIPINQGGLTLSDSNLQSLCGQCHAKKTATDKFF